MSFAAAFLYVYIINIIVKGEGDRVVQRRQDGDKDERKQGELQAGIRGGDAALFCRLPPQVTQFLGRIPPQKS